MPHYTTRTVYWLIAFLMRKTGPERAYVTRMRQLLRPWWNRIRPARMLAEIVRRFAPQVTPDAHAPDLLTYNEPTVIEEANCFAFILWLLSWVEPGSYAFSDAKAARKPLSLWLRPGGQEKDWLDYRSPILRADLFVEGGFRRAHLSQVRQRHGEVLIALLARDDGRDFHVMLLACDGLWYDKPGKGPARGSQNPWSYPGFRVRGLYWMTPTRVASRVRMQGATGSGQAAVLYGGAHR